MAGNGRWIKTESAKLKNHYRDREALKLKQATSGGPRKNMTANSDDNTLICGRHGEGARSTRCAGFGENVSLRSVGPAQQKRDLPPNDACEFMPTPPNPTNAGGCFKALHLPPSPSRPAPRPGENGDSEKPVHARFTRRRLAGLAQVTTVAVAIPPSCDMTFGSTFAALSVALAGESSVPSGGRMRRYLPWRAVRGSGRRKPPHSLRLPPPPRLRNLRSASDRLDSRRAAIQM